MANSLVVSLKSQREETQKQLEIAAMLNGALRTALLWNRVLVAALQGASAALDDSHVSSVRRVMDLETAIQKESRHA